MSFSLPAAQALAPAQDDYLYRIWSVESGLPQISVTAITQDQQGFIWLGTQNGLARFDGVNFVVYNSANTPALSSNLISALYFDSQQRLWIGTANGLVLYQQYQFSRIDDTQPFQGIVSGIAERPDGSIVIGADKLYQWHDGTMAVISEHTGPVYQVEQQHTTTWIGGSHGIASLSDQGYQWFEAPDSVAKMQVNEIAVQGSKLYLGTNAGLFSWQRNQWQQITLGNQQPDTNIEMLYVDRQQQLWVSTVNALFKQEAGVFLRSAVGSGSRQDFVWVDSMLQDKHNNLWLGSRTHGLKRLRRALTERYSAAQGIPDTYVWAVAPWQHHVLVGTNEGLALLQRGQYQTLTANNHLPNLFVYSLLQDDQKRLWVGTRAGLSRLDARTLGWQRNYEAIDHLLVTTLAQEANRIWVGTKGGLYYVEQDEVQQTDVPEALRQARIRIVFSDSQKRLWVGTENGLYLRDEQGFSELASMPLSGRFISAINEFADGNIIVGSFDQGFVLGQPGQWHWFSQQQGLPGNGVLDTQLVDNQLIISNFEGFYRTRYDSLLQGKVEQMYMLVDDRQPEAATDSHRCCNGAGSSKGLVHEGRLWYPTLNGVISLPLKHLTQTMPAPEAVIASLTAADTVYHGEAATLPPAHRDWHFRFTAPYFVQASSLQLRYQLQGYDDTWIDAAGRREAFYTNLPAGNYTFRVEAKMAADYRWSDTVMMTVRLTPYWHETVWARSLFVILLVLLLWGAYRWRLLALARSQRQLSKLVEERTFALHQANEKLQQMSMQDALTGLHNRHYLDMHIQQILSRGKRHAGPLVWVLLDLDHFKRVNDTFGHQTGDTVLLVVADILRQNSRGSDHIIRWGGEEFLLILEHSEDGVLALQRIHQAISNYPWQNDMTLPQTCSIGAMLQMPDCDWQHCLRLADQALYWVKQHGRNGYMLLQAATPVSAEVLADNASVKDLLAEGKLHAVSNKDFTAVLS